MPFFTTVLKSAASVFNGGSFGQECSKVTHLTSKFFKKATGALVTQCPLSICKTQL